MSVLQWGTEREIEIRWDEIETEQGTKPLSLLSRCFIKLFWGYSASTFFYRLPHLLLQHRKGWVSHGCDEYIEGKGNPIMIAAQQGYLRCSQLLHQYGYRIPQVLFIFL